LYAKWWRLQLHGDGDLHPAAKLQRPDSFTFKVNDGSLDSNTATASITVTAVNDAPVAVNDKYSTNEDTTLTISAPGVLATTTDADGDAMTAVISGRPDARYIDAERQRFFSPIRRPPTTTVRTALPIRPRIRVTR
jgi:hypothetical protein